MKTANSIPKFALPGRGKRGYAKGETYAGHTLRRLRKHHAKHREFPSPPPLGGTLMFPADANRLFARAVWHNWKFVLTAGDRLAWTNLAATLTITNYKGVPITPTGFQLYDYFETFWKTYWYIICHAFDPTTAVLDTGPYLPWTPAATPTAIAPFYASDTSMLVNYDSTPGMMSQHVHFTMAVPGPHSFSPYTKRFMDVNASAIEHPTPTGHYQALIIWGGVLNAPPRPGTYRCRIQVSSNDSPYTPSGVAEFDVTLPL